ncbi:hypothetical protein CYLTODRAFT_485490 [Cylindrobasidium torrendii FP15055 ss-10]|uniref:Nucleolar pre-ribosomal-associated protein 1 C-terminal domain-containing protein n=1 Tax=Cylindrobasidium torrendii FP15055 ss-10 TaxID=1314674 RepID=A0A0D7BS12_9AGAR|nr:hypothetical protein CYLTODRAFT_485490 [Cylindrobasidium torrendii FP15055 ss-10]
MSAGSGKDVYISGDQIHSALKNEDQDALTKALSALRNQLSISVNEVLLPQDKRLLLAQQWLTVSPGAQKIFDLWDTTETRQTSFIALLLSVLASTLSLLTTHYTYQTYGHPIVKRLLDPSYAQFLKGYIGGANNDLTLASLKLYNAISRFASGKERRTLLEAFPWELKSLPKLMNMRRKGKHAGDPLDRPDIRTVYILFLLSFIDRSSSSNTKALFLEQRRDAFLSMFKGLHQDSYIVIRHVLEISWAGLWSDAKLKRTLKVAVFNETTLIQLCKIYDNKFDEDGIPADVVHHFLLAICTHPGTGVCFKETGWYPRENVEDDRPFAEEGEEEVGTKSKIYNKILNNLLRNLKPNEDPRQQELVLKILAACPELIAGYWTSAGLTLEPRLSSRWLTNIAIFGSIVSLPIPQSCFVMPDSTMYRPTPPPLSIVIENIFSASLGKGYLSKALQPTSRPLVQHATALALGKSLAKFRDVMAHFQLVSEALEETHDDGLWSRRRQDLEREARKRVPDFQVIVAFAQRTSAGRGDNKSELLAESSHRLLWLYQDCLPSVVSEARFDVGKLLAHFLPGEITDGEEAQVASGLEIMKQLHVLRVLEVSDQFAWTAKYASSKESSLAILLKVMLSAPTEAIKAAVAQLVRHLLSTSILFQDAADEVDLWLRSLPTLKRSPAGAESPDGARLTDEADGVLAFLDDCIQRCMKTPYRYIEEMQAVSVSTSKGVSGPSPLIMTVKEQLLAKLKAHTLSPSDTLALATFTRKIMFHLSNTLTDARVITSLLGPITEALCNLPFFEEFVLVGGAVKKEVEIMRYCIGHLEEPAKPPVAKVSQDVREFLTMVEGLKPPATADARANSAYELVDWFRLLDSPIRASEMIRLVLLVHRYHPGAVKDLVESANPAENMIWDASAPAQEISESVGFDWLFVSSNEDQLQEASRREVLVEVAFHGNVSSLHLGRHVTQVGHALAAAVKSDALTAALLDLLNALLSKAASILPEGLSVLKEKVFVQCQALRQLSTASTLSLRVISSLNTLVENHLDAKSSSDKQLVGDIAVYWADVSVTATNASQLRLAKPWIPYLDLPALLQLAVSLHRSPHSEVLYDYLLNTVRAQVDVSTEGALLANLLKDLVKLRALRSDSVVLDELLACALTAIQPMCIDGKQQDRLPLDRSLFQQVESQWQQRSRKLPSALDVAEFLEKEVWSGATSVIIQCLLYRKQPSTEAFATWIRTGHYANISRDLLIPTVHAYLDVVRCRNSILSEEDSGHWLHIYSQLVSAAFDIDAAQELKRTASSCIVMLYALLPQHKADMTASLIDALGHVPVMYFWPEMSWLGRELYADCPSFASAVVEHGAQWSVRYFNEDDMEEVSKNCVVELAALIDVSSPAKSHIFEPLLAVIVPDQLSNLAALKLVRSVLKKTSFKPLVVNRVIQSIVQAPKFVKLCTVVSGTDDLLRVTLVDILHILFNLHPTNTCQVNHVVPLLPIYYGTVTLADRKLLSIFRLFEIERRVSVAALFEQWDSSPDGTSNDALEAIQSMDAALMHRTCTQFPSWRTVDDQTTEKNVPSSVTYDPVFVVLLASQMLAVCPPTSRFGWVELFRTNVVGVLIMALSAKDDELRLLSVTSIAALWKAVDDMDMIEATAVRNILTLLRNTIPPHGMDESPRRLPTYTTLLLAHALRGLFYPHQFIYPITARFLLQRPELDSTDLPMLFSMLYSSTEDWKKERAWMIHFLGDGLVGSGDWRVFKRRHTWDLLASIFQSSKDRALRRTILEVLANLTCIPQAVASLVFKSGLLPWIEMQLRDLQDAETTLWLKVLENIMTVGDTAKMETSTGGQWKWTVARCLSSLLKCPSASKQNILSLGSRILLRLSHSSDTLVDLREQLESAMTHFNEMEKTGVAAQSTTSVKLPHTKSSLQDDADDDWDTIVENLWRVSMTLPEKPPCWDSLTARMLVKQSMHAGSVVANWVRIQTVNAECQ